LICAVIHAESKFKPGARSGKNAAGLMQLTEPTAEWVASELGVDDYTHGFLLEPENNIVFGCYYLNWLMDHYGGDPLLAVCAYNAGAGNVNKWLSDKKYSVNNNVLITIPFPETEGYMGRVINNYKIYSFILKAFY
jgi:soluble lytic murein transglycosylase